MEKTERKVKKVTVNDIQRRIDLLKAKIELMKVRKQYDKERGKS